jgi:hypothetical protein
MTHIDHPLAAIMGAILKRIEGATPRNPAISASQAYDRKPIRNSARP